MKTLRPFSLILLIPMLLVSCADYLPEDFEYGDDPGGNENTNEPFAFTDSRDGNSYQALKIGDQIWMIENLAYLPEVTADSNESESQALYYVAGYSGTLVEEAKATANYQSYGVWYNWPAAMIACPAGWHLPSDLEWQELEKTLGMAEVHLDGTDFRGNADKIGFKMKSVSGWIYEHNGDNSSRFNAFPAGSPDGSGITKYANFWTSTLQVPPANEWPWYRALNHALDGINRSITQANSGLSIRCIQD